MNCQEFYQYIDEYIENELEASLADSVRDHLDGCTSCQHRVDNRLQLSKSLSDISSPQLRDGFADRAIHNAIQANTPVSSSASIPKFRWAFGAGFSTALATSFAIWFLVNTFSVTQDDFHSSSIQVLNIEVHESKTVKILFNSPQAMQNAIVSLLLPEHIELEGYTDRKSLTWSTQIKAGRNVLSLPVRALDVGRGDLVTKVEFGGKSKTIRFNVNVNQIHQSKPIEILHTPQAKNGITA